MNNYIIFIAFSISKLAFSWYISSCPIEKWNRSLCFFRRSRLMNSLQQRSHGYGRLEIIKVIITTRIGKMWSKRFKSKLCGKKTSAPRCISEEARWCNNMHAYGQIYIHRIIITAKMNVIREALKQLKEIYKHILQILTLSALLLTKRPFLLEK